MSAYEHDAGARGWFSVDLRADAGDDECPLLRADHGDLRSIVDADGYGRAELYAIGHGRADDERVKRPPRRQHSTTTTANTERISDTHHAIPPYHSTPCRLLCRRARDIIIALIGRIGAASTATRIPILIPIRPIAV